MKNKNLLAILFNFFAFVSSGQTSWQWAQSAGSASFDQAYSISVDAYGDIYICGYFVDSVITFGTTTITNAGNSGSDDAFLAKYNAAGNIIRAQQLGGVYRETAYSVTTDSYGNVFVAGFFNDSSTTIGNFTLVNMNPNTAEIFLAKLDSSGNVLWAQSIEGYSDDYIKNIYADPSGSIYLAGSFASQSITVGGSIVVTTMGGWYDMFIAKFDSSGNVILAKGVGGSTADEAYDICTDANSNIYMTGYFNSPSISFGSSILTNTTNNSDFIIAKFDSSGNELWAKSAGSIGSGMNLDLGKNINADMYNNIYVIGDFSGDSLTLGNNVLLGEGFWDFFLAKYDTAGNVQWASSPLGPPSKQAKGMSINSVGEILVTGPFNGDSIIIGNHTIINSSATGNNDLFVAKYDSSGNVIWTQNSGGSNASETSWGISTDSFFNVYIVGNFYGSSVFGTYPLTYLGGNYDIFIARISETNTGVLNIFPSSNLLSLFPNPASDVITIDDSELELNSVEVFDVMGKRHNLNATSLDSGLRLDISSLASGIYFIKVSGREKSFCRKFIIKRN